MFRSKLFTKAIILGVIAMALWIPIFYLLTIPMVDTLTYQIEERAGRTILDDVFQIVDKGYQDRQHWRRQAIESRQRELRDIVVAAAGYVRHTMAEAAHRGLSPQAARARLLDDLRYMRYGNNDYVWAADYSSRLISHPDPQLNGADFSHQTDVKGNLIVPPMVRIAREQGDGFYSYWWRRLDGTEPVEKMSFALHIPELRIVIGTGVYIDDIDRDVAQRAREELDSLRTYLRGVTIASSGYVYVFDGKLNMLIHPSPSLEGKSLQSVMDPATGKPIAQELIEAQKSGRKSFEYVWDKPSDPGNFSYRKVSWIRYFPGLDWYLVSSAYKDELEASGAKVGRQLMVVFAIGFMIVGAMLFVFMRAITAPILRLVDSARRIGDGDLRATTGIRRKDEIGLLAETFDKMVSRLRTEIDNLESRVAERTREHLDSIERLKTTNEEIALLGNAGQMFQACESPHEIGQVASSTLEELFPDYPAQVHFLGTDADDGAPGGFPGASDCWALRRGAVHLVDGRHHGPRCRHAATTGASLCVPLIAQGNVCGLLHLASLEPDPQATIPDRVRDMAVSLADKTALSLANVQLRENLRQLSIRDPLTRLPNRRHMEDYLAREHARATREGRTIGMMMIDIDYFKRVNDSFGHEAGDAVLCSVAEKLRSFVRPYDLACRYGGEEFVVALAGNDAGQSLDRAEELRKSIADTLAPHIHGENLRVTVSIGVAVYPDHGDSMSAVLEAADGALYEAKNQGRNRVCLAGSPLPAPPGPAAMPGPGAGLAAL